MVLVSYKPYMARAAVDEDQVVIFSNSEVKGVEWGAGVDSSKDLCLNLTGAKSAHQLSLATRSM